MKTNRRVREGGLKAITDAQPKVSGLYAITPDSVDTESLLVKTRQVLAGGAKLVQYRNKVADILLRRKQAKALLRLCHSYQVPLIINDYLDLALEIGADGVHLGQDDGTVMEARKKLGRTKIIGVSCYNRIELAITAETDGVDYVAFGAFFASVTKPGAVIATMELLALAKQKLHTPFVAIGGVTLTNARTLISSGSSAIAVSNALYSVKNIEKTAQAFAQEFR